MKTAFVFLMAIAVPLAAWAAPPRTCGSNAWKKVPDSYWGTIKELCGSCELKKGRSCGGREVPLRCLFQPAEMSASKEAHPRLPGGPGTSGARPYADLFVRSCAHDPTKKLPPAGERVDWVNWDSVFCGKPSRAPL